MVQGSNNGCLGACGYDILRVGSQNRLQNGKNNGFSIFGYPTDKKMILEIAYLICFLFLKHLDLLCGAYGLFDGSEELIGARILLPAIISIYKATPGLLSDVNWPLRS